MLPTQFERRAWRQSPPLPQQLRAPRTYGLKLFLRQTPACELGEVLHAHAHSARALAIKQPDHALYFDGFVGESAVPTLSGRVVDVPAIRDQTEETAPVAQRRLYREVRQIVEWKERRVGAFLFL